MKLSKYPLASSDKMMTFEFIMDIICRSFVIEIKRRVNGQLDFSNG